MRRVSLGYNAVPRGAEKAVVGVFRSGQYSPGPKVLEFEKVWAKAHGAEHAVFVNSGTDALRLSLMAMKEKWGWRDGDEVAVPALTFVATINVILQAGLKPFFVDVGMYDFLINPDNLRRRIGTSHTTLVAVMPVHLFGRRCGDEIFDMAEKYRLKVLEDSCETVLNGVRGDVSCHSTYMAHHVTTGVGGMAVTDNEELRYLIWSYANHGRREPGKFNYDRVGYSCRGTEFEAVLGLSQMGGLRESIDKRRAIARELIGVIGYEHFDFNADGQENTWMMFPVVIKEMSRLDRGKVCAVLERAGIETRPMMPVTNQPCYRKLVNENYFPVAQRINKNGFYIACHLGMSQEDIRHIGRTFDKAVKVC